MTVSTNNIDGNGEADKLSNMLEKRPSKHGWILCSWMDLTSSFSLLFGPFDRFRFFDLFWYFTFIPPNYDRRSFFHIRGPE
jgi:hypothetical protein